MAKPVLGFPTIKACRAAIKAEVDPHITTGREFYSPLVARLFRERHYALSKYGVEPIAFRWQTHPEFGTDRCFYIRIEDNRWPLLWWRKASWNKAVRGWQLTDETLDGELAEHYRRVAFPVVLDYRARHNACEQCGAPDGLEVHHAEPHFKVIAAAATALLTADERAALIATHDWFSDEPWILPDKCRRAILAAHATAKLQVLCNTHHKAERKKK